MPSVLSGNGGGKPGADSFQLAGTTLKGRVHGLRRARPPAAVAKSRMIERNRDEISLSNPRANGTPRRAREGVAASAKSFADSYRIPYSGFP